MFHKWPEDVQAPAHTVLDGGDVWVMVDAVREVFYVDALIDSSTTTLRLLFEYLHRIGFSLAEDWEYEPVELRSGHIRRFLIPTWE